MPVFARYIGIDYSGAQTPTASLKGPARLSGRSSIAARRGAAAAVAAKILDAAWRRRVASRAARRREPTLVGIDHGFSFPLRYFEAHGLEPDWPAFLDDFQRHWPTDEETPMSILCATASATARRDGQCPLAAVDRGTAAARNRSSISTCRDRWRSPPMPGFRGCASSANGWASAFISGRSTVGTFRGRSAIAEVYPALWSRGFARADRTGDQHDAYTIAAWLSRADRDGSLAAFLKPALTPSERAWRRSRAGYWA